MLFRMFDLTSGNLSPVVNFEGISKNVMTVGFQVQPILTQTDEIPFPMNRQKEGGCSQEERIAQPEYGISKCEISPARCTLPWIEKRLQLSSPQRIFQANAPVTCACLHPNQQEMVVGDQSGAIHIWNLQVRLCFCLLLVTSAEFYRTTSPSRLFLTPKLQYNMWP